MAIAHYQFETIHPFRDGNGRTGRVFNIHYLTNKGLLDYPILFLSRYILDNKDNYYINGYTYQLQQIQNTLLNNKELKIFKCNVFINDEIIL